MPSETKDKAKSKAKCKKIEGGYNMVGISSPINKMRIFPWNPKQETLCEGHFLVAIAAGGGKAKTGIANFVKFVTIEREEEDQMLVMNEYLHLDTKDKLISDLSFSPEGDLMALSHYGDCLLYSMDLSEDCISATYLYSLSSEKAVEDCYTIPLFLSKDLMLSGGSDGNLHLWGIQKDEATEKTASQSIGDGNQIVDISRHPSYSNIVNVLGSTGVLCIVVLEKNQIIPILRMEPPLPDLRPRSAAFINDEDLCALYSSRDKGGLLCRFNLTFEDGEPLINFTQYRTYQHGVLVTLASPLYGGMVGVGTSNGSVALFKMRELEENSIKDEMHDLPVTCGLLYPGDGNLSIHGCMISGSFDGSINILSAIPDLSPTLRSIGLVAVVVLALFSLIVFVIIRYYSV